MSRSPPASFLLLCALIILGTVLLCFSTVVDASPYAAAGSPSKAPPHHPNKPHTHGVGSKYHPSNTQQNDASSIGGASPEGEGQDLAPTSAAAHEILATIPGPRCTGGGDIFPKRWSGRISSCHLTCRSHHEIPFVFWSWRIPADCAWRGEWHKASSREWEEFRKAEREIAKQDEDETEKYHNNFENVQEVWHQHTTISVFLLIISNFAWLPNVIWSLKHRLVFEPVLGVSVCVFVSFFHACKDGLFCVAPYSVLFFMDAWIGASGIFLVVVHSTILRPSNFRKVLYSAVVGFGMSIAIVSYLHEHPKQLSIAVGVMLLFGLLLVIARYAVVDRTRPAIVWRKLAIGWGFVFLGMAIQGLGQQYMHYPHAHSLWHCLTATAGYCTIGASLPTGHLLTVDEVIDALQKWRYGRKIAPKGHQHRSLLEMNQPKEK